MGRYWTSPSSCAYVDDYVYLTINFPQPVPEPSFDILFEKILEIARYFAIEHGGVFGKRYRVDEDDLYYEDNPIVNIDGKDYVTYTGNIRVMTNCEDGEADSFIYEIEDYLKKVGGVITETEIVPNI